MSKRWITVTIVFFVAMAAFTYLSRSMYIASLPQVQLCFSEPQSFTYHIMDTKPIEKADDASGYKYQGVYRLLENEVGGNYDPKQYAAHAIDIHVEPDMQHTCPGEVLSITYDELGALVTVGFHAEMYTDEEIHKNMIGKKSVAEFKMSSKSYANAVPATAIQSDGRLFYIFTIKEQKGALGDEYVAEQISIVPGLGNGEWIGVTFLGGNDRLIETPIIYGTDTFVMEGDKVRFYP